MRSYPFSGQVAKEIRAEMVRRDLTVEELAAAVGISEATAFRRLSGELPFTLEELRAIATWLELPPAELVANATASRGSAA